VKIHDAGAIKSPRGPLSLCGRPYTREMAATRLNATFQLSAAEYMRRTCKVCRALYRREGARKP
jgi:hypothetical protein